MSRSDLVRSRSRLVYGALAFGALVLSGRLAFIQVIDGPRLSAMAREQRTRKVDLASVRREIIDRQGREFAVSVDAASIYAQPSEFEASPSVIAQALAPLLGTPAPELTKDLEGKHWRWLQRQRPVDLGQKIRALKIPGIGVIHESRRVYPKGSLASTLLGFVGVDNKGLAGLEQSYDDVIKGKSETLLVEVDARGREILRESPGSPMRSMLTDGPRVELTLDETIQHIAERELARSLAKHRARRGAVLMMDPTTGDMLAYAALPSYDPNRFREASWESIKNWPATDLYEPGSTMKIFTLAGALETGAVSPSATFPCGPRIQVAGRTITDHDAPPQIRHLDLKQIMEVSSNVGTVQAGLRMTAPAHRRMLAGFGFGKKTESGLKGEAAGVLPALPWRTIRQATVCYGYGITVTPLQLLTAASAFANDGTWRAPRFISRVVSQDGTTVQEFPPAEATRAVSEENARAVKEMLKQVVSRGTGTAAQIPGYNVAGKTGTANKAVEGGVGYSRDVISSFIGFVPAEKPRFIMLALLDSPQDVHWASMTAVPLFRAVALDTLRYLGVQPNVVERD